MVLTGVKYISEKYMNLFLLLKIKLFHDIKWIKKLIIFIDNKRLHRLFNKFLRKWDVINRCILVINGVTLRYWAQISIIFVYSTSYSNVIHNAFVSEVKLAEDAKSFYQKTVHYYSSYLSFAYEPQQLKEKQWL